MYPFLVSTILIVFGFYFRTIFYGVKLFDEITPFKETFLPACFSFSEMFELISLLGLHQHFEATNTLYSSIVSLRCNPFGNFLQMFIEVLLKKSPVNYHLYSLCLHMINTTFVFLLINIIAIETFRGKSLHRYLIISLLTLLWALHPVNIESVLLLTNANIVLSYTFCFFVTYLFIKHLTKKQDLAMPIWESLLLFTLYLFALFLAEFHFVLPLVLFAYSLIFFIKNNSFFNSIVKSLKLTLPLIFASFIFIFSFAFSNTGVNIYSNSSSLNLLLERIFWLSPQVIFHFIKLLLFPLTLSIDQALLVKFGKSLVDPYAIGTGIFLFLILFSSLKSLFKTKKSYPLFFVIFFPFVLSLLPFAHILAPLYNLASERYLYFPSFVFIFGISFLIFNWFLTNRDMPCRSQSARLARHPPLARFAKGDESEQERASPLVGHVSTLIIIALITITYSCRSYIRTLDWKDSFSLYYSAIKATNNPLNKAFRYKGLTPQDKIHVRFPEHYVDPKYLKLAVKNLRFAISNLKTEKEKNQNNIPQIIKTYGLDPESLTSKAGYYLAQTIFTLNKNYKEALEIIQPFTKDFSKLDSSALSFYAGILFYNDMYSESEDVLRKALKLTPYSTRIIFPLCDLIYGNTRDLNAIENLALKAFRYFPYDTYTLFALTKIYKEKKDFEKYAYYSYIYGLRHHSIEDLENSLKVYSFLNKKEKVAKTQKRIEEIKKYLNA